MKIVRSIIMKKISILLMCTLLLAACNNGKNTDENAVDSAPSSTENSQNEDSMKEETSGTEEELPQNENPDTTESNNPESEEPNDLPELPIVAEKTDEQNLINEVVTDTNDKRIILYEIDGKKKYKSIYIKNSGYLKIIQIDDNDRLISNEKIENKHSAEDHSGEQTTESSDFPEYTIVEKETGDQDLTNEVVTDTKNKRIVLYEKDGIKKYKSIYIKDSHYLKIIQIDDNDRLIFNEKI